MKNQLTFKLSRVVALFAFLGFFQQGKAQYVTIPDPAFAAYLQSHYPSVMNGNQLNTATAASITYLNLGYAGISSLEGIEYMPNLLYLNCSNNNLTSLDLSFISPPGDTVDIDCSYNQLTSLTLGATGNWIWGDVDCSNNQLTSLDISNAHFWQLDCSFNNLTTLNLTEIETYALDCSNNQLTNLADMDLQNAKFLNCSYNQLTNLPDSLEIAYLDCSYNLLSALPTVTDPDGWASKIYCAFNQLTSLPELPRLLYEFDCSNNQIACFPLFPSFLQVLEFSNNPYSCVPNYLPIMTSFPPLCSSDPEVNPNGCQIYGNIVGSAINDVNENCLNDLGDTQLRNVMVRVYDSSDELLGVSMLNGGYNFGFVGEVPATYRVELDTTGMPFEVTCSSPGVEELVSLGSGQEIQTLNFIANCKPGFDVACNGVATAGFVFPGQVHTVRPVIIEKGRYHELECGEEIGLVDVVVEVAGPVAYQGPALWALAPTSVEGNLYTFDDVSVFEDFSGFFLTDTTAQAGDSICVQITVTPNEPGDRNLTNNHFYFCYPAINSYDPNHKTVYPTNVQPGYDDYLVYTIEFQNTGNAPAFNIRLADTMDANLNLETFEVLNYSHPVNVSIMNGIASFRFNNIMLPDSLSNPEGSIGHIQYRVKPKADLPGGTIIDNTAYIYFDYNDPIITNTAVTTFEQVWEITEQNEIGVSVYPNPGKGDFLIQLDKATKAVELEAYNVFGQKVATASGLGAIHIHLEDQPDGIYLLKVVSGDKTATVRVMKY